MTRLSSMPLLQARRHPQRSRLPSSALLQRLVRCGACACAMTSSQTTKGDTPTLQKTP
jgi:hypothetical protein